MNGISGKTTIEWPALAAALAPVETVDEPVVVKKRSRDAFWYSPVLNGELKTCFGDLLVRPKTQDELRHVLATAWAFDAPMVLRGGGSGNYGQAVPIDGGLIVEMTGMNRVLEIGEGWVRAEAGALMADVNAALAGTGQEMAMFPSTQDIATIGGFVAGGSAGIGSLANGVLRDPGNLPELRAFSVEQQPVLHTFRGPEVQHIHHAWGLNGAIAEVVMRAVPARDWIGCIATFDGYRAAYAAGYALAQSTEITPKLVSTVDARIAAYFPRLKGHIRDHRDLLVAMIPAEQANAFRALIASQGGHADLLLNDAERAARTLPHVYEFSYNHTTLQVLKADRRATYQQIGCPVPPDPARVAALHESLGDDVWPHHEFSRLGGQIVTFDLPILWYSTPERLAEINATAEAAGFPVYDAHTWHVEGGGLKYANYSHLAWKKRMDPKGLLNSAKSAVWDRVKHLSADQIEALGGPT